MNSVAEVPGARLAYEIAGSGPPVVLLHGGLVDSGLWDDDHRAFAEHFTTVRYDFRGFGRSEITRPGSFSHVDDLAALLDLLEIHRAALVGLSMGGAVAIEFALVHPERVRALVLSGPGLGGYEWGDEVRKGWEAEGAAIERGDIEEAVEVSLKMWTDGPRRRAEDVDASARAKVRDMTRRLYSGPDPDEESVWLDPPAAARLAELQVPVLVIAGTDDTPDIHAIADLIETTAPDVSRATVPGAHHPNLESPVEFQRLVVDYLTQRVRA